MITRRVLDDIGSVKGAFLKRVHHCGPCCAIHVYANLQKTGRNLRNIRFVVI